MKYIVGIDEVGRGPLAGPVTVGVVVCEAELYKKLKRNRYLPPSGKDSKKLSSEAREKYVDELSDFKNFVDPSFERKPLGRRRAERERKSQQTFDAFFVRDLGRKKFLNYEIIHISNKTIDAKGLSFSLKMAMRKGIEKLKLNPEECEVRLDGSLHAPAEFKNQKTIIKGDEKEKIIAWASILAKVSRDELLRKAGKKYPRYGFEIHKGYGTAKHRSAISAFGFSPLHRKTFCKNIVHGQFTLGEQ